MKKSLLYIAFGILGLMNFTGCSDDDGGFPAPTPLSQESIKAKAGAGNITLYWDVPADSNYYYVQIKYTIAETQKECTKLASVYSDSIVIDNLLERYGDINFTLQPFNKNGKGGSVCNITAKANKAPKQVILNGKSKKIDLTAEQLFTDNQESSEGPIANLIDNNKDTYFHMSWSSPSPFPHYIVVDLKKECYAFTFSYVGRNNANKDNPKNMDILVSNSFNGEYDPSQATQMSSLTGLPGDKAVEYTSGAIKGDNSFRYVWFKINSSTSGSNWIALAELGITEQMTSVYDPETDETTESE